MRHPIIFHPFAKTLNSWCSPSPPITCRYSGFYSLNSARLEEPTALVPAWGLWSKDQILRLVEHRSRSPPLNSSPALPVKECSPFSKIALSGTSLVASPLQCLFQRGLVMFSLFLFLAFASTVVIPCDSKVVFYFILFFLLVVVL